MLDLARALVTRQAAAQKMAVVAYQRPMQAIAALAGSCTAMQFPPPTTDRSPGPWLEGCCLYRAARARGDSRFVVVSGMAGRKWKMHHACYGVLR